MMKERSIKDYIFIVGGYNETSFNPHTKILSVYSGDYYEDLPEKVFRSYKFISNHHLFSKYQHFIKLDDDMIFGENIDYQLIKDVDYGGITQTHLKGNREYHIGRCSKGSDWNSKPYQGKFTPWCLGGYGYVLSRRAFDFIGSLDDFSYNEYASYEDLYVAMLLTKNNIKPVPIDFKKFFISPDHK